MNEDLNKPDYKPLPPFKGWVLENFPFIEADFDAITNYQLISKVVEYLNQVISNENLTEQAVNDCIDAFNALKNYVDNYFDNLDAQQLINNKLDEMAEDGSLLELLKPYLNPYIEAQFNLINDFKSEVNTELATMNTKVNSVVSGTPKGVYATVSDLEEADPDHDNIYLVLADGYWYYYDTDTWTAGGLYQVASYNDVIELLNKNYTNINLDKNNWAVGGFDSAGVPATNASGIRYEKAVDNSIKVAYVNGSGYDAWIIKRSQDNTITREKITTPYVFDHENYYYDIYLLQNPGSQSASTNDYYKLCLYVDINDSYNILVNKANLEEAGRNILAANTEDLWESGLYSASGGKDSNPNAIRTKTYIGDNITKIKLLHKDSDYQIVIARYDKNDTFNSRIYFFQEYDKFNHDVWKYKVYIFSKVAINTQTYNEILLYEEDKNNFDNINVSYKYDDTSSTYYSLVRVNKKKYNGHYEYPFVYAPHGALGQVKATLEMMNGHDFLVGINAGIAARSAGTNIPFGIIIENGVVIKDTIDETYHSMPLTIDNNGDLSYAAYNASAESLVANNVISAVCGWFPIIEDYDTVSGVDFISINPTSNDTAQRQLIGQFANGDYGIITCEGRGYNNSTGWTIEDCIRICKELNLKFVYCLDGGGSTETVISKKQLNRIYEGTMGREVQNYIIFTGNTIFPS